MTLRQRLKVPKRTTIDCGANKFIDADPEILNDKASQIEALLQENVTEVITDADYPPVQDPKRGVVPFPELRDYR